MTEESNQEGKKARRKRRIKWGFAKSLFSKFPYKVHCHGKFGPFFPPTMETASFSDSEETLSFSIIPQYIQALHLHVQTIRIDKKSCVQG